MLLLERIGEHGAIAQELLAPGLRIIEARLFQTGFLLFGLLDGMLDFIHPVHVIQMMSFGVL
ncbi:hypothetical protein JFPO14_contig00007-0001 [Edwardsiella piscicida]|nr:hypothetical protein JFPO14_contig00007-0001 [Edwardsiella piscicida]